MIYISSTNRELTEKYVNFAHKGLPDSVKLSPDDVIKTKDCEAVVFFGILRGTNLVYQWAVENKINFYYIDRPYWGDTRKDPYYVKVVKNNHLKNWQETRPDDRYKKFFPWKINPWQKGGREIVVCPPSNAIAEFFGAKDWMDNTLKILRANTDRPIKIRNKGYNPLVGYNNQGHLIINGKDNTPPSQPIVWENVHAVVTYNSNITLEATTRGIPCFTDAHNACAPISETDFTKIESPRYPDREPCYHSLAYGQFTGEEISNGYAWKVLNES